MLIKYFEEQRDFASHFTDFENLTPQQRLQETKNYILGLYGEVNEIRRSVYNYDWDENKHVSETPEAVLEEVVDALKHLINIAITQEFTAEDINRMFWIKSKKNRERRGS